SAIAKPRRSLELSSSVSRETRPGNAVRHDLPCDPQALNYAFPTVKAHLCRAIALLSLLSAVATVLLAGQSYFACPWMRHASKLCCCPPARTSTQAPAISRAPCCNRKTIAAAPTAATDLLRQATKIPPANAFSGELIRIVDRRATDRAEPSVPRRERGARAGPHADLFELHSVYLI